MRIQCQSLFDKMTPVTNKWVNKIHQKNEYRIRIAKKSLRYDNRNEENKEF
jgi:hypothetical protein